MEIFLTVFTQLSRAKQASQGVTLVLYVNEIIFSNLSLHPLSIAWLDTWTAKVSVEGAAILRVWCAPPLPLLSGQTSFAVKRSCPQGFN